MFKTASGTPKYKLSLTGSQEPQLGEAIRMGDIKFVEEFLLNNGLEILCQPVIGFDVNFRKIPGRVRNVRTLTAPHYSRYFISCDYIGCQFSQRSAIDWSETHKECSGSETKQTVWSPGSGRCRFS